MPETTQAILLVADISGYTKFMRRHAIATSHAKQIIVRLLKSIMRTSKAPLKVAELEGDAVFFYAVVPKEEQKAIAKKVKAQILDFFTTFKAETRALSKMQACDCEACSTVQKLKLKIVIHLGEIAIEQIEQFEKLFGLDVILAHRMLKNTVPSHEYIMMTVPIYRAFEDFYGLKGEHYKERFEEIGEIETLVFYPSLHMETLQEGREKPGIPGIYQKLFWSLSLRLQTMLEMIGLRKQKGIFQHVPKASS